MCLLFQLYHSNSAGSDQRLPGVMKTVTAHLVYALSEGELGGNPAAIILNADQLSLAQKQTLARQLKVSETAFVSASGCATVKLEFFTPAQQIAHCGHATVASFSLLREQRQLMPGWHRKETIDGMRRIQISADCVMMEQSAPEYEPLPLASPLRQQICQALGLSKADLLATEAPNLCIVSTGNRFLLVALAATADLAKIQADQAALLKLSEQLKLVGFYAFALSSADSGFQACARMFAPRYGIPEESATGTAAGPLACYLANYLHLKTDLYRIQQGLHMSPPSPSVIEVRLEWQDQHIRSLMAGGRARLAETISLNLD